MGGSKKYWRLAWYVAYDAKASNGYCYSRNDQIGSMSLKEANHYNSTYNMGGIRGESKAKKAWDKLPKNQRMGLEWKNDSSLAWFCSEGVGNDLTIQKKNIYNNAKIGGADTVMENKTGWQTYARENLYNDKDNLRFIGWKVTSDHAVEGTQWLIRRTSSEGNDTYVDGLANSAVYYNYDNGAETKVATKIKVNLKKDRTIWAYYAPRCRLTISAGEGTTISVNRTGGSYGKHGSVGNNGDIFKGDQLTVTFGLASVY